MVVLELDVRLIKLLGLKRVCEIEGCACKAIAKRKARKVQEEKPLRQA